MSISLLQELTVVVFVSDLIKAFAGNKLDTVLGTLLNHFLRHLPFIPRGVASHFFLLSPSWSLSRKGGRGGGRGWHTGTVPFCLKIVFRIKGILSQSAFGRNIWPFCKAFLTSADIDLYYTHVHISRSVGSWVFLCIYQLVCTGAGDEPFCQYSKLDF